MTSYKHIDFEVPGFGELASGPTLWPSYAGLVMSLGPVAYWRLGETTGSTASDETGAYDGSYQGSPTLNEAGALEKDANPAVGFDGQSDRVRISTTAITGNAARTLVIWAATTSTADGVRANTLFDMGDEFISESSANEQFSVAIEDTVLTLRTSNGNRIWSPPTGKSLTDGAWHCYAITFPGGNEDDLDAFMDGQPMPIRSTNTGGAELIDTAQHEMAIGSTVDRVSKGIGGYFDGTLDEPALFDRVLTSTETKRLHERGRAHFQIGA